MDIYENFNNTQEQLNVVINLNNDFENDLLYHYFATTIIYDKAIFTLRENLGLTYNCSVDFGNKITIKFTTQNNEETLNTIKNYFKSNRDVFKFEQSDIEMFRKKIIMDAITSFENKDNAFFNFWSEYVDINLRNLNIDDFLKALDTDIYWDEDFEEYVEQVIIIENIQIN